MQDYLVFQLYAPLAAWGEQAVGQERPSADHPSRSALLGLLAAALGIDRQDNMSQQQLSKSVKFGVKLLTPGLLLRDFHTIQMPPENKKARHRKTRRDELQEDKLGTLLSFRSYLQNSVAIVAIWLEQVQHYDLPKLQQALERPHYHLYLGRKSCPPAVPMNPELIPASDLKLALDHYCIGDELHNLLTDKHDLCYYWEASSSSSTGMENEYTYIVPRYDQPLNRTRWQFVRREEYVYLIGGEDALSQ
ncbi:MAG: type I-E CRISPR-associated protein Cas5/CasD [Proteobacteria bacterium]|nr:MAG: type I-E CRISPR-associated protein Cas5/CasD [Pseudomonadota bacterium]